MIDAGAGKKVRVDASVGGAASSKEVSGPGLD